MDTQDLIALLCDLNTTVDIEFNEILPELHNRGLSADSARLTIVRLHLRNNIANIIEQLNG